MKDYKRYGIEVGQVYAASDGIGDDVRVLDVETFSDAGQVVIINGAKGSARLISCVKLAKREYYLK